MLLAVCLSLSLAGGISISRPGLVAAVSCASTSDNKFLGTAHFTSGIIGVYANIEFIERQLCTQGSTTVPSWALSWISIDGPQPSNPGNNIFQGGYAKCGPSCPANGGVSYVWVYYARKQSVACGAEFNTGFIKIYNVTSGSRDFQISKSGSYYKFYVNGSVEYQRNAIDVDICWPGAQAAEYQNEMLNTGDQGGGSVSNHQNFTSTEFQTASGWHYHTRSLGSACEANSYPTHWHCVTSGTVNRDFSSWDDRFP